MANQPTVTIERWFTEGWQLYKRYPATFSFASLVGGLICIPLAALLLAIPIFPDIVRNAALFLFAAPLYAGLHYMALKAMRGDEPRIPDIFEGFRRYWRIAYLWCLLSLIAPIMLSITQVGVLVVPLLWAIALLVLPLLIDEGQDIGSAFSAAFNAMFTFTAQDWQESLKNCARFWLYGLVVVLVSCVGVLGVGFGLCITVPFAVCVQVIAYRDIFKDAPQPQQEYSFTPQAQNIGPISQIRELRNQIFEQIRSASDEVKPLLEDSIGAVDNVFAKADRLSQRLQEIDAYLKTTNMQTLNAEKVEITEKLAEAPNTAISAQYQEALHTLEERIENHGRLEELREQINAQLVTIRMSLGNMQAKIIRIKTTEISNARLESNDVSQTLQNLQIETDALLESLDEVSETA